MKKDYISGIEGAERRYIAPIMEVRAEGDSAEIFGTAAVIESVADLGWFEEKIAHGAFDDALSGDTVALFNHDQNLPLARTTAKKEAQLRLFLQKDGSLGYSYPPPNTSYGKDLTENIKNEVIKHSSFAFTVAEEKWELANKENGREKDLRIITKIKRLYDVAPVTYPAYQDTTVAARSKESLTKESDQWQRDKDLAEAIKVKHKI